MSRTLEFRETDHRKSICCLLALEIADYDAKPVFEIIQWKIGEGWYVRATLPNQAPIQIDGFKSEDEAARWIRKESLAWLHKKRAA